MQEKITTVPDSLWSRPVAAPYTITDVHETKHTVVECTDGMIRYVKDGKVLTDKVYCANHRDSHPVDTDADGKVTMVHVPQSC